MAIQLQFLCVVVPRQVIDGLRDRGAFDAAHPLLENLSAPDRAADGEVDWLAMPDPAETALRFKHKWRRRQFRPAGGYFVGGAGTEWYDGQLYCNTFMNSVNADDEIEAWMAIGLTPYTESGGTRRWQDLCVAASRRGLKYPCDWFDYDIERNCAWLRGTHAGEVVGGYDGYEAWLSRHAGQLGEGDA